MTCVSTLMVLTVVSCLGVSVGGLDKLIPTGIEHPCRHFFSDHVSEDIACVPIKGTRGAEALIVGQATWSVTAAFTAIESPYD